MSLQFIKWDQWMAVRDTFTEEEKLLLNKAIVGETICPRGVCVDITLDTSPLLKRIVE